jgi:hypothetical protein
MGQLNFFRKLQNSLRNTLNSIEGNRYELKRSTKKI